MTRRMIAAAVVALALVAGTLAAPGDAAARQGSIVYLKGGKIWVASPDGKVRRRVPHAGTFESPSQADNGVIVAQRGIYFHRMNRRGKLLNKPITTAYRTNPILTSFKGPFWPEVSPDGTKIAYTYSFTTSWFDPSCNCQRVTPSLNTAVTYANRFVDWPDRVFGVARMYSRASWIDNRRLMFTTPELFNFAGTVLDSVAFDTLGGGDDSYRRWFSECDPCDSLETLRLHRLDQGEMTRQQDKLAFVSGPLGGTADGSRLLIYRMAGALPAFPSSPCHVTGVAGRFSSPTWSPDGKSLAWADAKGIWVARVDDLSGTECGLTRRLVVPGGSQPDWGPAPAR